MATPGSPLNGELRKIRDADPEFDPVEFLDGAKVAYEMIVNGFADGDRKLLKGLLSPEVYADFEKAIAAREGARAEALAREHARLALRNLDAAMRDRALAARVPGLGLVTR